MSQLNHHKTKNKKVLDTLKELRKATPHWDVNFKLQYEYEE